MINRVDFNKAGIGETIRFETNVLGDDIYKEIKLDGLASKEVFLSLTDDDIAKIVDEFDITEIIPAIREFGVSIGIDIDDNYDYYHIQSDGGRYILLFDLVNDALLKEADMNHIKSVLRYSLFTWYKLIYQINDDYLISDFEPSNESLDLILKEIKRLRPFKVDSEIKTF